MNSWEALILGLVQGLTEFLPVSSSGHLMIGRALLGVDVVEDLTFEVVVHTATVLSTMIVFRRQILSLLRDLFRFRYNDGTDYILKIALSMLPVFVVGVFFKDYVTALFTSMTVVGCSLLVTALLLLLSDNFDKLKHLLTSKGTKAQTSTPASSTAEASPRNGLSYLQAFGVGLAQSIAVLPGLSRSGTTISVGLLAGIPRSVVAQFSFLMVLVPILGESFLSILDGGIASSQVGLSALLVGFAAAFVSGLFACKVMIALVKRARLSWFALYCALAGILTLIFL